MQMGARFDGLIQRGGGIVVVGFRGFRNAERVPAEVSVEIGFLSLRVPEQEPTAVDRHSTSLTTNSRRVAGSCGLRGNRTKLPGHEPLEA
jgi:hypothetical protein